MRRANVRGTPKVRMMVPTVHCVSTIAAYQFGAPGALAWGSVVCAARAGRCLGGGCVMVCASWLVGMMMVWCIWSWVAALWARDGVGAVVHMCTGALLARQALWVSLPSLRIRSNGQALLQRLLRDLGNPGQLRSKLVV